MGFRLKATRFDAFSHTIHTKMITNNVSVFKSLLQFTRPRTNAFSMNRSQGRWCVSKSPLWKTFSKVCFQQCVRVGDRQKLKACAFSNHGSLGSRDGAVLRALASHQCGPGSIRGPGAICGVNCWFSPCPERFFFQILRFSPLLKNQHF